ncbi:ABC transporter substrate-binding protein [Hyphomicrobium sp. CS1BSMeth3]|uniref:ABC transporter substrate-binding protein n=1 Tax=Hyphomicrobium sp. CS1BSMeth3 TaxID=1892844 RepID=UPI000931674E|nr:ABC transporter substrate-binding protein [Hyphomicrobium sp. CS1BSMeth3]
MTIPRLLAASAFVTTMAISSAMPAAAQEREIRLSGFGAMSGVVRSFGINSKAALEAAADEINKSGGVKLGDGTKGKIVIDYFDDRCNAEEGISVTRRIASTSSLVGIGPTCSNVAEPLFGVLQKKVGDAGDSGLQFPIFTDVAIKGGLAKISEWAFRNVPDEGAMYAALFQWLKKTRPELKTIFGGVEEDFAHSRATWYAVMKEVAAKEGFEIKGEAKWLLADTNFTNQAREARRAAADIVAISAHPFTTCGMLKELGRQGVKPKLVIGLTSSSSLETLQGCAAEAEAIIIPTSFAPVTPEARAAADRAAKFNGSLDLHSGAAYEIVAILKDVIEGEGVLAKSDTVQADRAKIRNGLSKLTETKGLIGISKRTEEGEAVKPFLFVHAKGGKWEVLHNPTK